MDNASTPHSTSAPTPIQDSAFLRASAAGAAVAALVNVGVWAAGRAGDVSFTVTPPAGDMTFDVSGLLIAIATLSAFAFGIALLRWASRRSRQWERAVLVAAAVVAAGSAGSPWMATDDTATALLLGSMHLITGVVFLATATRSAGRAPEPS